MLTSKSYTELALFLTSCCAYPGSTAELALIGGVEGVGMGKLTLPLTLHVEAQARKCCPPSSLLPTYGREESCP